MLLGEVGGKLEHDAARFIKHQMSKPVVALIFGRSVPRDAQMGPAGAIIEGDEGTAGSKINGLKAAGAYVAKSACEIPEIIGRMRVWPWRFGLREKYVRHAAFVFICVQRGF